MFLLVVGVGLLSSCMDKNSLRPGSYQGGFATADGIMHNLNELNRGWAAGMAGLKVSHNEKGELMFTAPNDPPNPKRNFTRLMFPGADCLSWNS